MSAHKPLEGVKVVELASFVAAPTAGRMMAEMGADVIRVESTAGDPWRFYGANCGLPITDEENPLFDIYNLGKKDIQLNTKTPEGKEILFHLLDEADVFITNNRLKSLVRSGLDYESLKDRFPKLIYGLVTGYGQTGPDVDAPGYDGVAFFSRSGMLADMAEPSGYPASAPGCIGDGATGAALFGGICAALFDRVRTGKGDFVEISLFGNAVWLCGTMSAFEQYGYVLMEGRYVEENKHDSAYHYVYLDCPEGDWRFKITVDAEEKIVGVKEIYTIDHAIKIFKQEVIGEKYDELKTMDKFAEIMKKYAVEEKGETELQTVEGTCASETGKELNGEGFFVPVENETIAFVAYDEDYNIVEVTAMKSND